MGWSHTLHRAGIKPRVGSGRDAHPPGRVSGAADVWGRFEPALPALRAEEQEKSKVQPIFETPHLWGCLAQALSFQFPREKRSWSAWKSSLFRATPELILPSRGDGGIFCGLQQPLEARFFYKRGAGKQRQRHATRCWTASSVSLGKPAQLTVDHEHPKLHRLVTRFLGWQILPSWSHCTVRSYYTYLSFS